VLGARNTLTGVFFNAATLTVTAQLYTSAGVAVGSAVTLAYVTGSQGDFQGTLPADLAITVDEWYELEVYLDGGGPELRRRFRTRAVARRDAL
jgi:hypothetical protein